MATDLVIKMIISVVGGLGIFLLGMKNMSEGMQAVAGSRMRKLINAVTNNRIIACGVGACMGCAIRVRGDQSYARVCTDGPVFNAEVVRWK